MKKFGQILYAVAFSASALLGIMGISVFIQGQVPVLALIFLLLAVIFGIFAPRVYGRAAFYALMVAYSPAIIVSGLLWGRAFGSNSLDDVVDFFVLGVLFLSIAIIISASVSAVLLRKRPGLLDPSYTGLPRFLLPKAA